MFLLKRRKSAFFTKKIKNVRGSRSLEHLTANAKKEIKEGNVFRRWENVLERQTTN